MALSTLRISLVTSLALGVCGCAQFWYHGDGKLSDKGPDTAHERYVLDLGPFDFARASEKTYEMSNLPGAELTVGIQVICIGSCPLPLWDKKPLDVNVELSLTNERGETVVATTKRLANWTWSAKAGEPEKAFVYLPGEQHETSLGDGRFTYTKIGVAADGGWGTYFTPRPNGRYKLNVATSAGDAQAGGFQVRIQAMGGGWK